MSFEYIFSILPCLYNDSRRILTTAGSFKPPPVWLEDQVFVSWKAEVMLWTLVTDLDEKKRGISILAKARSGHGSSLYGAEPRKKIFNHF